MPILFLSIWLSITIPSCKVMHTAYAEPHKPITVITLIQQDTITHVKTTDTVKLRQLLTRPVAHLIDNQYPPYDTLLKYNMQWQQHYLRVVDTAIKRRLQRDNAIRQGKAKDTALIVAKLILQRVISMDKKQTPAQQLGDGVRKISDTICTYFIYWIALVVTAQILLNLFNRKKHQTA